MPYRCTETWKGSISNIWILAFGLVFSIHLYFFHHTIKQDFPSTKLECYIARRIYLTSLNSLCQCDECLDHVPRLTATPCKQTRLTIRCKSEDYKKNVYVMQRLSCSLLFTFPISCTFAFKTCIALARFWTSDEKSEQ